MKLIIPIFCDKRRVLVKKEKKDIYETSS